MKIKSYRTVTITLLFVVLLATQFSLLPASTTFALAQQQPTEQGQTIRTVSVSGSGMVNVQPDTAVIRVGVETSDADAGAAMSANSEQMQALITALEEAGVAAEAIQTQTIRLQPQLAGTTEVGGAQSVPAGETPQINGYVATNTVEVRTTDLAGLGDLLNAVVAAGGNQIDGIRFEVSEAADSLSRARATAWNDARGKAEELATLAGATLGDVITMSEFSRGPIPLAEATLAMSNSASVPVQPGTQDVNVELQVTWQLQ